MTTQVINAGSTVTVRVDTDTDLIYPYLKTNLIEGAGIDLTFDDALSTVTISTSGMGAYLLAANNLSDLANATTARTNLGLGTVAILASDNDGTLAANSATRVATQQAVKTYVDGNLDGRSWKQAVRAATTVNGTLATAYENGDTIDGVVLATGDRILLKNQTAASENGIYVVAATGAPTRSTDANTGAELVNATCYVSEGTVNADTQWSCTANAPITIGSTSLPFAQSGSGAGGVLAANNGSDFANLTTTFNNLSGVTSTSYGRGFNALADTAAARTYIGAVIGTNVQAWDAGLDNLAAKTTAGIYYLSATDTWSLITIGTGLSFVGGTLAASGGTVPTLHPGYRSGVYYAPPVVVAPTTGGPAKSANVPYAMPMVIYATVTIDRIAIVGDGAGSATMKMAIYNSANGVPTTLVAASNVTQVDSATGQEFTFASNPTLQPGCYFIAVIANASFTVRYINSTTDRLLGELVGGNATAAGLGTSFNGFTGTDTYAGAWASPFVSPTGVINIPLMGIRPA